VFLVKVKAIDWQRPLAKIGGSLEMASQEKHYIELSDILALRCDCKLKVRDKIKREETSEKCDASLSLPLTKGIVEFIDSCPKCRHRWAGQQDGINAGYIHAFVTALETLKGQAPTFDFRLYLEIASDPNKK
jgi:hypothetical protein